MKQVELATCVYLLIEIPCWLHVVFILILSIFCLFIQSDVNNSSASHHFCLFTYANSLLITCPFRFNNHDLFVYLFKVMSTTASQTTTCFYLLMQITCWLHVLFVLIFSIYLFIYSKWCKQMQRKSPPVFIYLWKMVVDYMWFSFEYSVFICLFIQSNVNNSRWKLPPVFIYLCKWFFVKHGFHFNIYYLFFYLFKAMSTKAGGTDHLFLFTYGNLLFIYCGFRFNIHYLFIYLFKVMWTKTSGSHHLLLFTYANGLLIASGFLFNIYYIVVYLFKAMSTKAGGSCRGITWIHRSPSRPRPAVRPTAVLINIHEHLI